MKGIVLAGGKGSRLYPLTKAISKQLVPIYDKPLIYYSLSVLMLAGIKDILIITTSQDRKHFEDLLGDGNHIGISLTYSVQEEPRGIAEAFIIGEEFIKNENVCLILGDNIFYGSGLTHLLEKASERTSGATIFGYNVSNPERFGVVDFTREGKVKTIEEKPQNPKSSFAITGLYFYDSQVVDIAKSLVPSNRGELEITDINNAYLKQENLNVELLSRGFAWLDAGTHESLLEASNFVETIEKRQNLKVACLEEIAYLKGFISKAQLIKLGNQLKSSGYGDYLIRVANKID